MINVDEFDLDDSVRLKLLKCKNKTEVESVFANEGIENSKVKTEYLYKAMQIKKIYGTPDKNASVPTEEEIYNSYLKFYFHGLWKEFVDASNT